jgi:hypothetical protein
MLKNATTFKPPLTIGCSFKNKLRIERLAEKDLLCHRNIGPQIWTSESASLIFSPTFIMR